MKMFVTGGSDSERAEAKPVARLQPLPVGVELILLSCLIFIVELILQKTIFNSLPNEAQGTPKSLLHSIG